jgi:hypothetical protein
MLQIAFTILCLILSACSEQLVDQSKSNIEYRVISLPGSNRRQLIDMQFSTLKNAIQAQNTFPNLPTQPEINFAYFDAIRGADLDRNALIQSGYFTGSLTNGELGLVKTTTDIVIPAAISLPDNTIQVNFEDDVIISIDLDLSFRFALRAVPADWDMLFLGCNQDSIQNGPFYPTTGNPICPSKALAGIPGTLWTRVTQLCLPGAYAYALSKASAQKIEDLINAEKPISKPIDIVYQDLFANGKINAYCLRPELVRVNYGLESVIGGR